MVHTIPAVVALALIIQILIIQICCTTEDDWPLVGASDRSGHCSTGTGHVRGPVRVARGSSCDWHSVLTSESDRPLTVARHRDRRGLRVLLVNAGTTRAGRAVHAATCTVAAARGVAAPTQPGTPRTRVNACAADNALRVTVAAPLQHMRLQSDGSSVRVCIDPSRTLLLVA